VGSSTLVANAVLSLLNLWCHLLDRQLAAQAQAFETKGGFTERPVGNRFTIGRRGSPPRGTFQTLVFVPCRGRASPCPVFPFPVAWPAVRTDSAAWPSSAPSSSSRLASVT